MAEEIGNQESAEQNGPVVQLQRCYFKDASLEMPHAPEVFTEALEEQPVVDIQFEVAPQQLSVPDYYEVVVRGTVTVKSKEQVLFLVEGKQAGIFQISGIGEEDTRHLLNVYCPSIVYPYLRANVADLNEMVENGSVRELIRVNEALHEKRYAAIADDIVQRGARAVMVAGPSSSGKTTSANRLYTHLRVLGKNPVLISLDNYYIDRDKIQPDENGELDLESIDTLDVARFNQDLEALIDGKLVETPIFDFKVGRRAPKGREIQVAAGEPMIIEGIHGLNQRMISPSIPAEAVFRVYISALTTLNLDDHNRIRTTDIRLLRRLVRDYETRGASVEHTMSMWPSVQRGERTWIFPYQEQADALFNTTLVYEPAVLKKHIYPLLLQVTEDSPYYADVHSIIKFLNYFQEAEVEDEIPPTSILREFIGGNAFYR